ncbi:sugar O-acyltransferase, sialic acid O-acetyltransferase NeuD family [Mesorhizobium albiziae]|uniref:Sugar O-acyltransferase, sialic acid O-acetyltransferase NeuD family n=1 Tax=Neomesorhizobium albiziae TaxID=335020 RepID=A0A1I4F956_9HYPH|nr:NeuD/PglB/VioB family sugar acetyltransferase [Mesorhizobium albiziae]SFL14049.1 sugar O-acyltransferase, sialic acid O-acetyltransferase NeuD family [Mesorhizobium albiziae]
MIAKRERVVIIGAGGHGRVCAEIAASQGLDVTGFVDSGNLSATINGVPVVARDIFELSSHTPPKTVSVFVAIGNNITRSKVCAEVASLGYQMPILCHPHSWVSPTVTIGAGTVLMPGVVVNANTRISTSCILNTCCSIDHDNILESAVQICPGVRSAGNVCFEKLAFVGTGAVLIPSVRVGAGAVVGAGSVVVRDVQAETRVAGNPAKKMTVQASKDT